MTGPLARLAEDQPCTCWADGDLPHKSWCGRGDLVPGYAGSADGAADARDQRKADTR